MEKQDFEKVTDLLTPKFRKTSDFDFRKRVKSNRRLWWRISSAAAILAVILTATLSNRNTVRAEEIVKQSIENINAENSYRVEFYVIGRLDSIKNHLDLSRGGEEINGTLYVLNDNGTEIDIVEVDGFTEIYDGKSYKLLKNDSIIVSQPRSNSLKLLDLFKLDSINKEFSKFIITTNGDSVKIAHRKNEVTMHGVFSKKTNQIIEAYVTGHGGKKILGTRHIEYGAKIPEKYFE
ncbi:MAG: hypothetical protein K2F96_07285 [Muribaculaceae bacterium]|nr:hypothetical protein [Muribaculaceae bacterium]